MFYYKTVDENGAVQRLFTSNYKEYSGTEITKEEYLEILGKQEKDILENSNSL